MSGGDADRRLIGVEIFRRGDCQPRRRQLLNDHLLLRFRLVPGTACLNVERPASSNVADKAPQGSLADFGQKIPNRQSSLSRADARLSRTWRLPREFAGDL